eukprot:c8636_g1_i1.p1 GENE.c8636_g1_i1~~c8636_g1_i1.p1  ORF type:complete len:264 (+),score=42.84 c8636_g1_i1:1-792(+)
MGVLRRKGQPHKSVTMGKKLATNAPKPVTETVLRKRKVPNNFRRKVEKPKKMAPIREKFKRLEKFVLHSRRVARSAKRVAFVQNTILHNPPKVTTRQDKSVTLVVRNTITSAHACSTIRSTLKRLHLQRENSGVFVHLDDNVLGKLMLVKHFVTWGQPSLKSVKDIVYKHAKMKGTEGEAIALTDNRLIEEALGKFGMVCVEDIVHQLHTVGSHFEQVTKALLPFSFSASKNPYKTIGSHYNPEAGKVLRGESHIDALIRKIN